jgi:hypothetical protein
MRGRGGGGGASPDVGAETQFLRVAGAGVYAVSLCHSWIHCKISCTPYFYLSLFSTYTQNQFKTTSCVRVVLAQSEQPRVKGTKVVVVIPARGQNILLIPDASKLTLGLNQAPIEYIQDVGFEVFTAVTMTMCGTSSQRVLVASYS